MGFVVTQSGGPSGNLNIGPSTLSFGQPLANGDQIWIAAAAAGNNITLGGSLAFTNVFPVTPYSLIGVTSRFGVWKHDWVTGDATSFTITEGSAGIMTWTYVILRSDYAASGSWTEVDGTGFRSTPATNTPTVKQVTPTSADYDYRLVFVFENSGGQFQSDRNTPKYLNLTQRPGAPATTPSVEIMAGVGPTNFDAADGTIQYQGGASAETATFAVALNDGSGAYFSAAENDGLQNSLLADAQVWGLASVAGGDDSANARWEGGGPRLLS